MCVPPHSSRETSSTSTIRTQSPYFSPKSAIAPSASASSRVVSSARTWWLPAIQLADPGLHGRQLLRGQPLAMGEVEAQLVGAHVGAGLAHVGAQPLAQRRVQQVGGGVVAHGGQAGVALHLARAVSPGADLALERLQRQRLVVAEAEHVHHPRPA